MEKSLFEQMGGTYTQVGDYLLPNLTLPEREEKPIGIWGQRHARHLKQYHKVLYMTSGKLNNYLADIDERAEDMFFRLVNEMAKKQGITEQLKITDQMDWVGKMNAIRNSAMEIINNEIIFTR
ncbi:MAG: TnpV protein [[Eubacterium] siraeum]